MKANVKTGVVIAAMLVIGIPTVYAQTQRSGGDGAARAMQQLQQVTAEKAKLQQDYDAQKKELDEVKAKLAQASSEQGKLQQRARELEQSSSQQEAVSRGNTDALDKTKAQLQELIIKFRETAQTLKEVETDRDALRKTSETQAVALKSCVDKNAQMYLLSNDVLDQYGKLGVWSALKTKDAFTQISRARLENLADDYRDRISEFRLTDRSKETTASR